MRLHKRKEILVELKDFNSEDDALDYALHEQRDRRNLTDGDILSAIELIDKRMAQGAADGFRGNQHTGGKIGRQTLPESKNTAENTARKLGISKDKVNKARTIIDRATPATKAMISGNEITINRGAQEAGEFFSRLITNKKLRGNVITPYAMTATSGDSNEASFVVDLE